MISLELALRRVLLALVLVYRRVLSPGLGNHCRYHPSCSAYAQGCLQRHGPLRGSALAIWRLLRCNPFSRGGYDPVPPGKTSIARALVITGRKP
jgi:putative membrane protein insertion efficiency factor